MTRISFIDLGSNSSRFVIYELSNNGSYQLIYQQKESIRLSEGMSSENKLTPEAMQRAITTLQGYSHMAEKMQSKIVKAVATAAVRLAKNGDEFIDEVKEHTGINLTCISGLEEARLGFLGVINTIDAENCILFDLGGASIEISLVLNRQLQNSVSLPMGALTLTETFQRGSELSEAELTKMTRHISKSLNEQEWLKNRKLPLIGVGGTVRNLGKMNQRMSGYPLSKLHNYEIEPSHLASIFSLVKEKPLAQRRKISGLSQERADIIVAGVALINKLFSYTKATQLIVSGSGLREGLFYEYYTKNYLNQPDLVENVLQHSVENKLLSLPQNDLIHAQYVADLAGLLFDQWQPLHNAPARARRILMAASLLHDFGKSINYYSHARHSAYIIINSTLYGLTHREQALCSFLAANSHGINGRLLKLSPYTSLLTDDDIVLLPKVSILLALAEAIDETHEQIALDVDTTITDKKITLTITTPADSEIVLSELAMEKLKKQCKKEFKRSISVIWKRTKQVFPN